MTEEMKIKRENLKAQSRMIQQLVKQGMYNSVNEGLAAMYSDEGHTQLNTFKKWLELGYVVKKGSKALLLWAQPKKYEGKQEQQETTEPGKNSEWFPVAYVFSNLQVEKL